MRHSLDISYIKRYEVLLLLTALLVAITLIYRPGLQGDFIFDDTLNIVLNRNALIENLTWNEIRRAADSGIASQIKRPISMVTFGLNHYFTSLDPYWFKATNLAIHLVITIILYFLTRTLLRIPLPSTSSTSFNCNRVALIISALWALHPVQVSTVLYVVQRMAQLGALFSILAMIFYCFIRQKKYMSVAGTAAAYATLAAAIILGVLSKEIGALAPAFIFVIEIFLFRANTMSRWQTLFSNGFILMFLVIPGIFLLAYVAMTPEFILSGYETRDFSLAERLMTECRVLWDYIRWVLVPNSSDFIFYQENYTVSRGVLTPPSTIFAIVGIFLLPVVAIALRYKLPYMAFGIAFFLCGHLMEASVIPLELVFEHRNYLPSYGLLFGVVATLFSSATPIIGHRFATVFSAILLLIHADISYGETKKWSSTPVHVLSMYQDQPNSRRINYSAGQLFLRMGYNQNNTAWIRQAQKHFLQAIDADSASGLGLASYIQSTAMLDEMPADDIRKRFLEDLRAKPVSTAELLELMSLTECFYLSPCRSLGLLIPGIYQAIGENRAITSEYKQQILDEIALNILIKNKQIHDAISIYYFSETLNPELSMTDIKIILLEIERGRPEQARQHLEKARSKPSADGNMRLTLQNLERDMAPYLNSGR